MNKIGEMIRERRRAKNITQEELGKLLFVSKQAVSKWETGRTLPDIETLQKLCEILEIDPSEILGGTVSEVRRNRVQMRILIASCAVIILSLCLIFSIPLIEDFIIKSGAESAVKYNDTTPQDVTMIELIANPEKYDGRFVRVTGVVNIEFEGNAIYLNKEEYKYHLNHCIWIELDESLVSYEELKQYNGRYVVIEGIYDKDDKGHFSLFCGTVENISRFYCAEDIYEEFYGEADAEQ